MTPRDIPDFPRGNFRWPWQHPRPPWFRLRYLLPAVLAVVLVTTLAVVLTSGLSKADRTACDGGKTTQRALGQVDSAITADIRADYSAIASEAWFITKSAARHGSDELRAMSASWGYVSSPLTESDIEELLEWCRGNGWDG